MQKMPKGAGKSSFDLIDSDRLRSELGMVAGQTILDVGCGVGNYAVFLAERVGASGKVHAVDAWQQGIEALRARAAERKLANINPIHADAAEGIPVQDAAVDLALVATVLHDFVYEGIEQGVLRQISRVLKPRGRLAVLEFKRIEGPPGPPLEIRLSQEALQGLLEPHGFRFQRTVDIGDYHYLSVFQKQG